MPNVALNPAYSFRVSDMGAGILTREDVQPA